MKKQEKKEPKVKLVKLPVLLEKAQIVFNRYIRERDKGRACISCGSNKADQAGHWIAVKKSSFLRYDPMNVHLQCAYCNKWQYGNPIYYRIELVKRIGQFEVERLERALIDHNTYKWSRAELEEIIATYTEKYNSLTKAA